ncbi:MAG: DUF485 domain-containing protein [Candidatus Eremiobacteraeota bacterium]|nr:DUF485 domain-containing protein [Candidatus Eremiobacteraeota bacterium]
MTYEQMQKRQLRLSLMLAAVFLCSIFAIPFLNYALPEAMLTPVFGIPFVWLAVGILLHIEFWIIATVYTIASNRWESEVAGNE